jgi:NAD(P)-dependent dehydrogenase (short-subunit alcohol dehydrogenase family)
VETFEVDFTDEQSVDAAARALGDGELDVLVNCGGMAETRARETHWLMCLLKRIVGVYHLWDDKPYTEIASEDFMDHFKVNVMVSTRLSSHRGPRS